VFTLNIITNTIKGETYRCLTEVSSAGDAGAGDTVVAEMTTY
jgi:hypothetical protein